MLERTRRLADLLIEDRDARARRAKYQAPECITCGRLYHPRPPNAGDNTRFCSDACRKAFDAGFPAYSREQQFDPFKVARWRTIAGGDPGYLPRTPMAMGRGGFLIKCRGCDQQFESQGLAFHSSACRRASEARAVMAEVGMEPLAKRRCEAPGCPRSIPKWRKGRKVSKATRFCSAGCAKRAWRGGVPETTKRDAKRHFNPHGMGAGAPTPKTNPRRAGPP
jgi:hypothetical protein